MGDVQLVALLMTQTTTNSPLQTLKSKHNYVNVCVVELFYCELLGKLNEWQ